MAALRLSNTQARDFGPLRGLRTTADEPERSLATSDRFSATTDPKIAEIEDSNRRAAALFALPDAGWVPPGEVEPMALDPDPLVRSSLIDGKLEIAADLPTGEERRDRVKAILQDRLRDKAGTLAALAGNRFPGWPTVPGRWRPCSTGPSTNVIS